MVKNINMLVLLGFYLAFLKNLEYMEVRDGNFEQNQWLQPFADINICEITD